MTFNHRKGRSTSKLIKPTKKIYLPSKPVYIDSHTNGKIYIDSEGSDNGI
jgi:hypothetical protein